MLEPLFPIRIIFDDGECRTVDSPDQLFEAVDTIDTADPKAGVWIRDALDRTVRLRMRSGVVDLIEAV